MKNFTVLLSLLMIASCNQPNEEVTKEEQSSITEKVKVTAVESDLKCHMCPGYILIQKGEQLDTLESGVWGKPSKYIHFQKENDNFIAFPGGYYSGGTSETSIRIISLNDGDYLDKVFDTLVSDSFQSEMEVRRISFDFLPPDTLSFLSYTELYNDQDESSENKDSSYSVHIINFR